MPKVVLLSILWGLFWEAVVFGLSGLYFFPVLMAAVFIFYSPLVIKIANILIAGAILWLIMFLWVFVIAGFRVPPENLIWHISSYSTFTLIFISLVYVLGKK